ncbi:Trp biosynthesis-associated membrane protein [Microbacterium capsulatum]|uniref:Trp biosynthesis-associated membrane protein n=1 Tax=Microbacterium capsulatum TaxID=3041921 RepID=A0ABU0XCG7_9MICO|nr:Trp biosynthesis-associated membrane protein [Microbacterium sp. ASV81]MDQ4212802.1 Trp biosynthesis-associated membrane protein [Microbacterium sp. ASV81]
MAPRARRAKSTSLLLILVAGGVGILSSTQTWLDVARTDGGEPLEVAGNAALPVLAPLSLTALALCAALALVGPVMRRVFAALALAVGALMLVLTGRILLQHPLDAVAPALTKATGLAGDTALTAVIRAIGVTAWPWLALVGWVVLVLGGVLAVVTAGGWRSGGRRYRTAPTPKDGPVDAVESWDELSRGSDPTR